MDPSLHSAETSRPSVGEPMELTTGAIAAGGGCVARAPDGRVVFVRHALPGERVTARVTAETVSFLRADAVEILDASPGRVAPPCPHAGPARCGGCDFQHVALPAQRALKSSLVSEQLRRVARIDREVEVEEVDGAPDGLGWRSRVRFAVDRSGRVGFHRHRSHQVEPVTTCPIATSAVNAAGVGAVRWPGARQLEVTAVPGDGSPVVVVDDGRSRLTDPPRLDVRLIVDRRSAPDTGRVTFTVLGHRFGVGPGVFWQGHSGAASLLSECVLEGLSPGSGERAADLYAGAGLFTVPLARAVGAAGSVVAMERSRRACADARRNTKGLRQVRIVPAAVTPATITHHLGRPDIVVLDPARAGAGPEVMAALAALDPPPRLVAYVACDAASFARDLRVALDARWSIRSLRAFDLFPMTEHVELVCVLEPPPVGRAVAGPGGHHSPRR